MEIFKTHENEDGGNAKSNGEEILFHLLHPTRRANLNEDESQAQEGSV
jgi:hypothetical protein